MSCLIAAIFTTGLVMAGRERFMMMLPLCLSIAIVYKTTRCSRIRDIPVAALVLWVTIVAGMCAVGLGLWLVFSIVV